jgi:hypothetical protein
MLFPNYFSIDLLSKYIEEAKTLKYAPQSDKEFKRIEFLTIFEGLKQCLIK